MIAKSNKDRVISGVCGGLATVWGISSTLVRINFLVAGWFGLYLILWCVMPRDQYLN
ncbi:PspC domain-containing protein [Levilactobacillus bambusae]|uniref:PspC domain-containing protein n=1 Tax=Levilactobacillus bambusae TaxID=2024736 RepID=A0A2V1MYK6_9LACO|nr:PspC domain-containing protein [Levilactobacillus bambusae]PWG00094.1 PspC domain-containing protein [Levilactobacillus bambusae]